MYIYNLICRRNKSIHRRCIDFLRTSALSQFYQCGFYATIYILVGYITKISFQANSVRFTHSLRESVLDSRPGRVNVCFSSGCISACVCECSIDTGEILGGCYEK